MEVDLRLLGRSLINAAMNHGAGQPREAFGIEAIGFEFVARRSANGRDFQGITKSPSTTERSSAL